jgi:macrolide transport system ATP-binding/permease protein
MAARRMRTLLTMLGVVVGIASVVCVTAYGEGARREIVAQVRTLGTNVIEVSPGRGFGDQRANAMKPLTVGDVHALERLDYVDGVSPIVGTTMSIRRGNLERTTNIRGIGAAQFHVRGFVMAEGRPFDERAVSTQAQEAIVDENVRRAFFADVPSPLGQVLLVGSVPVRVVGVVRRPKSPFFGNDSLNVYLPYTTAMSRLTGLSALQSITLRVRDDTSADVAEAGIKQLLKQRHGQVDFFTSNTEAFRESVNRTQATLTLLLGSIALISLVVGGVGVMNIMLVTVTERTQEIGVRMAVGARRVDILRQFLIEAVLVCLVGGAVGVALALGIAAGFDYFAGASKMPVSPLAIAVAFAVSTAIGVGFGYAPARSASRLDPITALAGP